jgi:putative ABC transport system permease protein
MRRASVGLAGGVLGLLLTGMGVLRHGLVFEQGDRALAHLDLSLVVLTLLVAVMARHRAGRVLSRPGVPRRCSRPGS